MLPVPDEDAVMEELARKTQALSAVQQQVQKMPPEEEHHSSPRLPPGAAGIGRHFVLRRSNRAVQSRARGRGTDTTLG